MEKFKSLPCPVLSLSVLLLVTLGKHHGLANAVSDWLWYLSWEQCHRMFVETALSGQGFIELLKWKQKYYKISVVMKIHEHVLLVCLMKTVFQINNWITWSDDRAGSPVCIRKLPCGNLISVTEIDALNISVCLWPLISITIEVTALLALCWPVTCHLSTRSSQNLSLRAMLARETYSLWNVSVKGLSNASLNLYKQIFLYSSMHFCSVY